MCTYIYIYIGFINKFEFSPFDNIWLKHKYDLVIDIWSSCISVRAIVPSGEQCLKLWKSPPAALSTSCSLARDQGGGRQRARAPMVSASEIEGGEKARAPHSRRRNIQSCGRLSRERSSRLPKRGWSNINVRDRAHVRVWVPEIPPSPPGESFDLRTDRDTQAYVQTRVSLSLRDRGSVRSGLAVANLVKQERECNIPEDGNSFLRFSCDAER